MSALSLMRLICNFGPGILSELNKDKGMKMVGRIKKKKLKISEYLKPIYSQIIKQIVKLEMMKIFDLISDFISEY